MEKSNTKMSAASVIFKKLPKETNTQMGKNSPNMVTLSIGVSQDMISSY
jgi:uncharacterized pyridoxal phosphate-containing UPF0001 family protein